MNNWDDAKRLVALLDNEITQLVTVFATYARLFRGEADDRQLLGESDSAFFGDLYIVYLHYISVSVARLLDPALTGKKANLSIASVVEILRSQDHPRANELDERLQVIRAAAYNFVDPRNQLVSHMDLKAHSIDPRSRPIPSFTKSEFEAFYRDIGRLMNDIREGIGMTQFLYECGVFGHGCGRKLLHRLRTAHECIKQRSNATLSDQG